MIGRYLNLSAVGICNGLFKVYIMFQFFLKLETNIDYKKSMIKEVYETGRYSQRKNRGIVARGRDFHQCFGYPDGCELHDHQRISCMGKAAIQRSALFFCSVLPLNWRYPNALRQKNLKIRNWKQVNANHAGTGRTENCRRNKKVTILLKKDREVGRKIGIALPEWYNECTALAGRAWPDPQGSLSRKGWAEDYPLPKEWGVSLPSPNRYDRQGKSRYPEGRGREMPGWFWIGWRMWYNHI